MAQEITLHLLAVPHTITSPDFCSSCAFAGKVIRFSPMMHHQPGFRVVHYGVETSNSGADEEVQVLSLAEWNILRVQSMIESDPKLTAEDARTLLEDDKTFIGNLANVGNSLYKAFNSRLKQLLTERLKSEGFHIVCLPFGLGHQPAIEHSNWSDDLHSKNSVFGAVECRTKLHDPQLRILASLASDCMALTLQNQVVSRDVC